ncbi:pentapeptide repeat-containing protein [Rhodococcus sp. 5A-K4]|uniref:pentapeptide repeat-containing protein n=1 Tax=Rhodococcus sp. 5A-K4 TaxID=3384442 RepID=UPI00136D33E1|nr:hypothetical protein [Rhodococcus erythropolis]
MPKDTDVSKWVTYPARAAVGSVVGAGIFLLGRSFEVPGSSEFWDLAAQPLATTVAGAGAIAAGLLALHNGAKTRSLDASHHSDTTNRNEVADLRSRYTTAAQQMGDNDSAAIREAGIYAISALIDDWFRYGADSNQHALALNQARSCIGLLCSYLRANRDMGEFRYDDSYDVFDSFPRAELSVRNTAVAVLRERIAGWRAINGAWFQDDRGASLPVLSLDLSGANLRGANLTGANLRVCRMVGVDLRHANLERTKLSYADMQGAQLEHSVLVGVDFVQTDLRRADFSMARLTDVDLSGARINSASFTGTTIVGANFEAVRGLEWAKIPEDLVYTDDTKWPNAYDPPTSAISRAAITQMDVRRENGAVD